MYPPKKPLGLDRNLWLDVSPLRPSQYRVEPAMMFTQASVDQRVHQDAMADVAQEAAGFNRSAKDPPIVA